MEDLFSTDISLDDHQVPYHVIFDHEQYIFRSQAQSSFTEFSFRREHDEWHEQELLPADLRKQAIQALERYLMRQH
jgi:hypothetical protein